MRDGAMRDDTPTCIRCEVDEDQRGVVRDSQVCRGTRQQPHSASEGRETIVYWLLPYWEGPEWTTSRDVGGGRGVNVNWLGDEMSN